MTECVTAFELALEESRKKLKPPRRFDLMDCLEIAKLLGLEADPRAGAAAVSEIEFMLFSVREARKKDAAAWALEVKRLKLKAPRGAPEGRAFAMCADVKIVAEIYQDITGQEVKNSKSHAFYRLAQICTLRADPGKYIEAVTKAPWHLRKPGEKSEVWKLLYSEKAQQEQRRWLSNVIADALKPDQE